MFPSLLLFSETPFIYRSVVKPVIRPSGKAVAIVLYFVINQLDQLNRDAFNGKLDMDNIGMMGHSFGGATAFNAAYSNPKIKAGINMDGSLYNVNGKQAISKPFLFMESSSFMNIKDKALSGKISDEEIKNSGLTKEEFNKMIEERKKEYKIIDQASMVYINIHH